MLIAKRFSGQHQARSCQELGIQCSPFAAQGNPFVQITQLNAQDCSLEIIKTMIEGDQLMDILFPLSTIAQSTDCFSNVGILCCNHASIAARAEILGWIEAKASGISK